MFLAHSRVGRGEVRFALVGIKFILKVGNVSERECVNTRFRPLAVIYAGTA